ncbi:MAG: hypothetical protein ABW026_13700, partial [Microvirga sp.]
EDQADGPELELGAGESASFRVRACVDGEADSYAYATLHAEVRTGTAPTDDIAAELTIGRSDHNRPLVATVPFEDFFELDLVSCDPGVTVTFTRSDAGSGGSSTVTWDVEASIDFIDLGAHSDSRMTVSIDAMP